jgi:hypothetical protein
MLKMYISYSDDISSKMEANFKLEQLFLFKELLKEMKMNSWTKLNEMLIEKPEEIIATLLECNLYSLCRSVLKLFKSNISSFSELKFNIEKEHLTWLILHQPWNVKNSKLLFFDIKREGNC